jgi:hypothetical protein
MLKKITLSAEKELIEMDSKARCEGTTLNAVFCRWPRQYVGRRPATSDYYRLMDS